MFFIHAKLVSAQTEVYSLPVQSYNNSIMGNQGEGGIPKKMPNFLGLSHVNSDIFKAVSRNASAFAGYPLGTY